jgi:hypothetical protein
MSPRPAIIVTLVHGTILLARWPFVIRFMRGLRRARSRKAAQPPWYQPDSQFSTSLIAALGGASVEIRSFDWTGGNTLWDRLSAADRLCQHVEAVADANREATQILVGHSHGGSVIFTVAMFAVITMGAIVVNRRRVRTERVRAWSSSVNEEDREGGPARMIVTSDGDEALLALKIAEALSALARGLWRAASRIIAFVEKHTNASRRRAWCVFLSVAGAFLTFILLYDVASPWGPDSAAEWTLRFLIKAVFAALLATFLLFLLLGLCLFVPTLAALILGFPPLVFFRWLAFGWAGTAGVDMTAESFPLGTATAVRLPAPTGGRELRHSELYHDPRVPPLIATFILRTVDPKRTIGLRTGDPGP